MAADRTAGACRREDKADILAAALGARQAAGEWAGITDGDEFPPEADDQDTKIKLDGMPAELIIAVGLYAKSLVKERAERPVADH